MKESIKIDITSVFKKSSMICALMLFIINFCTETSWQNCFFGGKNENRETTYCERDILQNMQRITKIETADLWNIGKWLIFS